MDTVARVSPKDYILAYDRIAGFAKDHFKRLTTYTPKFTSFYSVPELDTWVWCNLLQEQDRPMSLILCSPTRYGKTEWARSLGNHWYMCGMFNLEEYSEDVDYGILDDVSIDLFKYQYKQWMGCQKEFDTTDKYKRKVHIRFGKPIIFLCNNKEYDKMRSEWDWDWIEGNAFIVKLTNKLYT